MFGCSAIGGVLFFIGTVFVFVVLVIFGLGRGFIMGSLPPFGTLLLRLLGLFGRGIALAFIVVKDLHVADAVLVDVAVFHGDKDLTGEEIAVSDPSGAVGRFAELPFARHTFGKFGVAVMLILETAFESAASA